MHTMLALLADKTGDAVTAAIVGGLVSIVVSFAASAFTYRTKVDEGLREKRLTLYKDLWQKTGLLPKWPRRTDLTYEQLHEFSEHLRKWYFDEGGIFLSEKSRDIYGKLQDTIGAVLSPAPKGLVSQRHEKDEYEIVRGKCSDLRSQLARDLLSRRGARSWF
jgi:hypothetical protein